MADGGAVVDTSRTFADIALGELHPSPTQPRRSLVTVREDPVKLAAYVKHIADTIEADDDGEPVGQGVREPLRVRRSPDGGFEIVDGECRFHAAAIKGLTRVCCEIVVLSDEQVIEEQLVANGARLDLTPIEEAEAFAALRALKLDDATIAERLGRTVRLVRQRLVLHDTLVDEGKALLAAGEISVRLAETLCTLSAAAQREVAAEVHRRSDRGPEPLAGREIEWEIKRRRLRLVDGGFPLDDAMLVPAAGACTACPHRSGNQAALFADGLDDADICGIAACFEGKRSARSAQIKARAKEQGLGVVDKPAEVKKLFPYGEQLAHDSAFIDLDTRCDLVRPPATQSKSQGRKGGPEVCNGDGDPEAAPEDGKHDFERGAEFAAEEFEDNPDVGDDERGCREALAAGCTAWVTCDNGCGAWQEVNPRPWAAPRGWKAPTWREVLGKALAQVAPAEVVKPVLVAEDGKGGVHELADRRQTVKILQAAKIIDEREAKNEIRQTAPAKKPGELDKFELDRKAREAAEEATLDAIVTKAGKKAPDLKFWKLLAGLCLAHWHNGEVAERARARRGLDKVKTKADVDKALREWVAAETNEGALRGLVIELLADRSYGDDSPRAIAARFYGVDVKALEVEAKTQIKAEAKEKAKAAAAKASKKTAPAKKTSKASPAKKEKPAALPADDEPATLGAPLVLTQAEHDRIAGEVRAYLGRDSSEVGEMIVEALCDDDPADEPKVRHVLAAMVKAGELLTEEVGGDTLYTVAPEKPAEPCPLTRADILRLGASIGVPDPHEGAHSPGNVWKCVGLVREHPPDAVATREALYRLSPSAGTGSFDLAIAWLIERGEARRVSGKKGAAKEVLSLGHPPNAPAGEPPCRVCGCTETSACPTGMEGVWCQWEEPVLCSVCGTLMREALKICRKAQSESAVGKALAKTWDPKRNASAVAHLLLAGKLRREGTKLVTVDPPK